LFVNIFLLGRGGGEILATDNLKKKY
jgi:hypothetical protein